MRRKKNLMTRIGEKLDIPREMLPGGFSVLLSEGDELTVRGCRHILSCCEREVELLVGQRHLCVRGQHLLCGEFGAGGVTVTGEITALLFLEGTHED